MTIILVVQTIAILLSGKATKHESENMMQYSDSLFPPNMQESLDYGFYLVKTQDITPSTMFPYFEGSKIGDDIIFNMFSP